MNRIQRKFNVFFLVFFISFFLVYVLDAQVSESLPLDNWAYDALDYFHARGYFENLHYNTKPFTRVEIALGFKELIRRIKEGKIRLSSYDNFLVHRLKQEFVCEMDFEKNDVPNYARVEVNPIIIGSTVANPTEKARWIQKLGLSLQMGEHIAIHNRFEMDTDGLHDSNYRGFKEWKNLAVDMMIANVVVQFSAFKILFGREEQAWGPGRFGGLILSGNAPSLDMVLIGVDFWRFRFTGFHAFLNRIEVSEDQFANRYLGGGRLDFRVNSKLELGVSQSIVYGGVGLTIQPYYVNPFLPYYWADPLLEEGNWNNNLLSFDFSWVIKRGIKIYGEYLTDDYVYEYSENPNKIAYLLGFYWASPFGIDGLMVGTEYARIMNWVYTHSHDECRYRFYDGIIGHPLGPDADNFSLESKYYLGSNFHVSVLYGYTRHGEHNISSPYGSYGYRHEKFPTGIVEKTSAISGIVEYNPSIYFFISSQFRYYSVSNKENFEGRGDDGFSFKLSFNYRFNKYFEFE